MAKHRTERTCIVNGKLKRSCLNMKVSIKELIESADQLKSEGENMEYDRGMAELIADNFPRPDFPHSDAAKIVGRMAKMKTVKRFYRE